MRLVTRGDLDGLTSAIIITMKEPIDEIRLVHPQEITDKAVEITPDDILANVPYHPSCGMWFDHHSSEDERLGLPPDFKGASRPAPNMTTAASKIVTARHFVITDIGKLPNIA